MSSGAKAGIGAVVAILVLISFVGAAFWYRKKRRRVHGYHAGFLMPSPASTTTQVLGNLILCICSNYMPGKIRLFFICT
jgi:riboflavin transporter FmnP